MISLEDAQKKLEYYCTYQERCHQEVTRKLQQLQVPYRDHGQIIARLIADDFLNETRFAIHFAGGKFRTKKWGKEHRGLAIFDLST
ncbi:MAG: regulatory protein RecX, partial [Flavobacteriaceae bacterium]